jgi:N-acetylglucosamine-6-phosphate deacetylase
MSEPILGLDVGGSKIAALLVDDAGRLAADAERFDATGLRVAPGFVDLQINGACGHDFTREPSAIWEVGSALPRHRLTDRGRFEPGMRADLVLLDDDLAVAATFAGGRSIYVREDQAWR